MVLLLPSGRSSHLEAGYGVGSGKELFIFGDLPVGEFDAMYGFAEGCFFGREFGALLERLAKNRRKFSYMCKVSCDKCRIWVSNVMARSMKMALMR